ncbi:replication associated protein [Mosquito circovirus]|uniref:replication associated protein n=1 Tax=Mosquito circovirus TaxID=1611039 RepID=UPI0005B65F55|nr:replication associated protein [Mosquito circovirus]AJM89740.1 replication associated protein [Mosquito circovirus]
MSLIQFVCWTLNNYSEDEYQSLIEFSEWRYIVIGREVGETGTPHLQGYGELKKRKKFAALKNLFPRVHWEQRRASRDAAANYCKKEGRFEERGSLPKNASEKSSKEAITRVKSGQTMRAILDDPPNLSGIRMCQIWLSYNEPKRNFKSEVFWYYGASGTGKTKLASEQAGPDAYWHDGTKWFDGYDAHEHVLLDDYRGGNMKFNFLLKFLDRYPLRLEVKGGYRQLLAKKIWVTSIKHPKEIYSFSEMDEPTEQLLRRITTIKKMCACSQCERFYGNRFEVSRFAVCGNTSTNSDTAANET